MTRQLPDSRDAPEALGIALQRVKAIPRQRHLLRPVNNIQPRKDVLDPVQLIRSHLLPIAAEEQTPQSPMPEGPDRASLYRVNCH
jgi:hypothetical protein